MPRWLSMWNSEQLYTEAGPHLIRRQTSKLFLGFFGFSVFSKK
jgi:hypothetical protein